MELGFGLCIENGLLNCVLWLPKSTLNNVIIFASFSGTVPPD